MNTKSVFIGIFVVALGLVPLLSQVLDQPFYIDMFTRILIFSIAALSLDLILGYGGMVSFGHAAYLGIGAYMVGILSYHGINNGFLHLGAAVVLSAAVAFLIGLVSLRTTGIHFIMITLAFAQMVYFLAMSFDTYGGDNGMNITQSSDFFGLIDFADPVAFYYFIFFVLVALLWIFHRIVHSRFGMVLRGAKSNERRMISLGFPVFRYKLAAFVISGAVCGLAGALLANQALFVSPSTMYWTRSGEVMVMVILGGIGSLVGPVVGAMSFLLLEHGLADITEHWPAIMGPILILVVMFANRGLFGVFRNKKAAPRAQKPVAPRGSAAAIQTRKAADHA